MIIETIYQQPEIGIFIQEEPFTIWDLVEALNNYVETSERVLSLNYGMILLLCLFIMLRIIQHRRKAVNERGYIFN